jgi:putative phosphoesterase
LGERLTGADSMKLAVLSDIHGNVLALEAVVFDAQAQGVTRFVNLGDIFYGPLWPRETFALLQRLDVVATIRGNQDRDIFEGKVSSETCVRTRAALGPSAIEWLRALPATATIEGVLLCHGTPSSDLVYLLERVDTGGALLREGVEVDQYLQATKESVVLCGHTHLQRCVRTPSGRLVINPGSVGVPAYSDTEPCPHAMETGSPDAGYAILERTGAGLLVRQMRVPYGAHLAAARARAEGREDWAGWLATGRAAPLGR